MFDDDTVMAKTTNSFKTKIGRRTCKEDECVLA